MFTRRNPLCSTVCVGLALCAAVALYALAIVLLVSP
jgi:F0F1-type ATP synthase membrane subunit c/vacuolar-type H+-ATPase subunit K